eukprot:m.659838 g.659838  ORF g.659838 m.659838 type:complete len:134 (+) comp22727_c1_seq2:43-444(+)
MKDASCKNLGFCDCFGESHVLVLLELCVVQLSLVMDKQMKVLAMVDFIFLPLTFMTGVYGMNFKHGMIELSNKHGYVMFWILCIAFTTLALVFFHQKRWVSLGWVCDCRRRKGKKRNYKKKRANTITLEHKYE